MVLQRRTLLARTATGIGAVAITSACGAERGAVPLSGSSSSPKPSGAVPLIELAPADGAAEVTPRTPVTVRVVGTGALAEVTLTNEAGRAVAGTLDAPRKSWSAGEPLGFGRTYRLRAVAVDEAGRRTERQSTFTTLAPQAQATMELATTAGTPVGEGRTYGVGLVLVAKFDSDIADRAEAERRMKVTCTPAVEGAWCWVSNTEAHWRPEKYHTPGTQITVDAALYGVRLGERLYGAEDVRASATIGASHVSIADDATKTVTVYDGGNLVRTMPTSMGMGGSEIINGNTISFWTQRGVYTVMDKANPVVMDSSTYGLPINSRLGYKQTINYATRISTDGIYLHQLDSSVWAQGNTNTSHGCLNLNGDNARWFFDFSVPGDIVEIRNTGGEPLEQWQNGDWSVPWQQWTKSSALASPEGR